MVTNIFQPHNTYIESVVQSLRRLYFDSMLFMYFKLANITLIGERFTDIKMPVFNETVVLKRLNNFNAFKSCYPCTSSSKVKGGSETGYKFSD
jgi:hypothetical protein